MRYLSITAASFCFAVMSTSTFSFAADQYTYRAGQAYLKSAAGNHAECEAQCRGDAACRGWNFVRPNPRSRSGICEFNARKAAPISSPISISGEINTSIDQLMSQAVPQIGNTVRVGTPIVPNRAIQKRPMAKRQMAAAPSRANQARQNPNRIVRRMPIPGAGIRSGQANYKRTIPAQKANLRTPRVYGSLEAPSAKPSNSQLQHAPRQQAPRQQAIRSQMAPQGQLSPQEIYRQQMLAVQRRGMEQVQKRAQQQRSTQQFVQQQKGIAANRMPPRMSTRTPQVHAPQHRTQQFAPQQFAPQQMQQARQQIMQGPTQFPQGMPPQAMPSQARSQQMMRQQNPYGVSQQKMAPQQMMTQQSSLYGSLHDDLTQGMTSVPRPQTAPDQTQNGDAPVATSRAVPTKPVKIEAIVTKAQKTGYPTIPGLAGG